MALLYKSKVVSKAAEMAGNMNQEFGQGIIKWMYSSTCIQKACNKNKNLEDEKGCKFPVRAIIKVNLSRIQELAGINEY